MRHPPPSGPLKIQTIIVLLLAALASLGADWADSWEEITRAAAEVTSIQAAFVQQKHLDILVRPLVSRGRLIFKKPASLKWEYTSPVKSLLVMHDGRTRQYVEREGRMVEASGAAIETLPVVMTEITRWFSGRFSESNDFKAELIAGRKIILSPSRPALARIIRQIELTFDDMPGMIRSVTIVESEASVTTLEFDNPQFNLPVSEQAFQGP